MSDKKIEKAEDVVVLSMNDAWRVMHQLTNYDSLMRQICNMVGVNYIASDNRRELGHAMELLKRGGLDL